MSAQKPITTDARAPGGAESPPGVSPPGAAGAPAPVATTV